MSLRGYGLALALLGMCGAPTLAAKKDVYALTGARILTQAGPAIERGTLVLRDGLIAGVGGEVAVPPDARVIDAQGLTLTPGLIDAFGGVGLPGPARGEGRSGGGAAARGASSEGPASTAFAPALDKLRFADALKARDKGLTTALVIPREGTLPGQSVLLNLGGESLEAAVLRQPFALHVHLAPLGGRRYPGSLMGVVALVRQALYSAGRYTAAWKDYEDAPRGQRRPAYDAALAAWAEVRAGRLPLVLHGPRENDLRRALALRAEFPGLRLLLAGALHAGRAPELARQMPLLVSVHYDPPRATGQFGGPDEELLRREIADAQANPAVLHRAGVRFALVSGHAADFLGGVRTAIEKGLPREAALRALTLGAAEALGLADRLGSLERGKIANVVAWAGGEPLSSEARPRYVFVDGALFEPQEKAEQGGERPGGTGPAPADDDDGEAAAESGSQAGRGAQVRR